jgi:hypothetical protein
LEEFSSHISNCQSLVDKMQKYSDRFEEAIELIDNPNKAKSQIIVAKKQLDSVKPAKLTTPVIKVKNSSQDKQDFWS